MQIDCSLVIGDFNAIRAVADAEGDDQAKTEYVITRWYRAPEVMASESHYSFGENNNMKYGYTLCCFLFACTATQEC